MDNETYKQLKDKPGPQAFIKKIREEHSKELKNKSGLSHRILNILLAGWSVVWSVSLIAIANLKLPYGFSLASKLAFGKTSIISLKSLIFWAPLYAFTIWAIGCALIILFHRSFGRKN